MWNQISLCMKEIHVEGKHEASWVTISTDEYESMKATIEVLSDPAVMDQLKKSEEDINKGRVSDWDDFIKKLRSR